jgi:CheY-like chemotaxis protein/DNA-binding XRE family transcriptional regulator
MSQAAISSESTSHTKKQKLVYSYIGQRIKERRKLLKMNQTQLAQMMGFSYQQMQKYENGSSEVSVSKLLQFAKILNVPPEYFYEGAPTSDEIGETIDSNIIQRTRTEPLNILLVEDNPADVILFKKAMSSSSEPVNVHVIHDAEMVQDFLRNHTEKYGKPAPDIILLDLSLPKITGMQLLKYIKKNPQTMDTPVIVLTNSIHKKELREAYSNGASGFIQKSVELEEYSSAIDITIKYWANVVALPHM